MGGNFDMMAVLDPARIFHKDAVPEQPKVEEPAISLPQTPQAAAATRADNSLAEEERRRRRAAMGSGANGTLLTGKSAGGPSQKKTLLGG